MNLLGTELTTRLIGLTLMLVTVTVVTGIVTDPVNVTKLFVLGGFAFATLGTILNRYSCTRIGKHKLSVTMIAVFMISCLFALFMSDAPITQSLYGVYGRNNGFLLYMFLTIMFISVLVISKMGDLKVILTSLFVAGTINLAYAYWVIIFGDFLSWENIYGNLLGTLGNPNFIGSFFGIFSGLIFSRLFEASSNSKMKTIYFLMLILTFFAIIETRALQGIVLFVTAGGLVLFFVLRSKFESNVVPALYLLLSFVAIVFSVLGTQKIGPLANFLYKQTVTLRGEYWSAAWQTGLANPFFGVGFDSFGDWYRRTRSQSALLSPGIDTVTNAAHNVYLDMFAFGGLPLFVSYIALTILTIRAIFRASLRNKEYDGIFVSLVSIWICYQLQSIVSINQVGLAIWGWISSAALLTYEFLQRELVKSNLGKTKSPAQSQTNKNKNSVLSSGTRALVLSVVGMLITVPPLSADMRWRSAQVSQNVNLIIQTLNPSYMNPLNTFQFNNIVGVLESNNFQEEAHDQAIKAVKFNPNNFESWRNLTLLAESTDFEKVTAYNQMRRLDPLNPTIPKELK